MTPVPSGPAAHCDCLLQLGLAGQVWAGGIRAAGSSGRAGRRAAGRPQRAPPSAPSQLLCTPRAALHWAQHCPGIPAAAGSLTLTSPLQEGSHGHPEAELHLWSLRGVSGPRRLAGGSQAPGSSLWGPFGGGLTLVFHAHSPPCTGTPAVLLSPATFSFLSQFPGWLGTKSGFSLAGGTWWQACGLCGSL